MKVRLSLSRFLKKCGQRRGWTAVLDLLSRSGLGVCAIALLLSASANADELSGIILDANGNPRPFVLVDVLGPTNVFTQADGDGRFSVTVSRGYYTVRIRDNRRRAQTEVFVDGTLRRDFKLKW